MGTSGEKELSAWCSNDCCVLNSGFFLLHSMTKLSSSQGFTPSSTQRAQEQNQHKSWSRKERKKEIQTLQKNIALVNLTLQETTAH